MSSDAIQRRVAKGAKLLDEKGPVNWAELIDINILDIQSVEHCGLGQVCRGMSPRVSGYTFGISTMLGVTTSNQRCADHGFTIYNQEPIYNFGLLRRAWIREVKIRLQAASHKEQEATQIELEQVVDEELALV